MFIRQFLYNVSVRFGCPIYKCFSVPSDVIAYSIRRYASYFDFVAFWFRWIYMCSLFLLFKYLLAGAITFWTLITRSSSSICSSLNQPVVVSFEIWLWSSIWGWTCTLWNKLYSSLLFEEARPGLRIDLSLISLLFLLPVYESCTLELGDVPVESVETALGTWVTTGAGGIVGDD